MSRIETSCSRSVRDAINSILSFSDDDTEYFASLVYLVLGKPLDRAELLSDWERRPLRAAQRNFAGVLTVFLNNFRYIWNFSSY